MNILLTVFFAFMGAAVGSFLNVVIDRLPEGGSLIRPPSHCPACQTPLKPADLIPVVSYIALGGRCHYCKAPIPKRLVLVEATSGLMFCLLYLYYGLTLDFAITAFYGAVFLTLLVIDLERSILPNKIVYPGIVVSLIITLLRLPSGFVNALIGGGAGFGIFLIIRIVSNFILNLRTKPKEASEDAAVESVGEEKMLEGMALGDVKMAALVGTATGFPLVFIAIFIAIETGGLIALTLLLTRKKDSKEGIPFGPYLSVSAFITLIWGANILSLYKAMFLLQ